MKFGSNLQILLLVVLGYVSIVISVPVFTGNAATDFSGMTGDDVHRYYNFKDDSRVVVLTPFMISKGYQYGLDLAGVHTYYDERTDTLYQGIECMGICGDSDGDGDAGGIDTSNPDFVPDPPDMCNAESIALSIWNDVPEDYHVTDDFQHYFPTLSIGKPYVGCIVEEDGSSGWLSYEWPEFRTCGWDYFKANVTTNITADYPTCIRRTRNNLVVPPAATALWRYQLELTGMDQYTDEGVTIPDVLTLKLNITYPHIEYKLEHYSKYPGFRPNYQPGVDVFRIGLSTFSGNNADQVGEDRTPPQLFTVVYDCFSTPGGSAQYDACGVCGGNNQTCWDCAHVPNGNADYDACGVCDGNNQTCWDCFSVPNGPAKYDACGVCDGNNQTCWDCAHIPNGHADYDACGVCGGTNQTCWDCAHVPNGNAEYDACGVCDGDNTTCYDCAHIPNGPARYDACGVCDGDNTTCWDCESIPNGNATYDACGICSGDGLSCQDCNHVPFGNATYDGCGVCGGHNETCTCFGYLGYKEPYLCYALVRWTIAASRVKITDTLDVLYAIKHELPYYNYKSGELALDEYVDKIHNFCDDCLDQFDFAQVWFSDRLAGNCVGAKCKTIVAEDFTFTL